MKTWPSPKDLTEDERRALRKLSEKVANVKPRISERLTLKCPIHKNIQLTRYKTLTGALSANNIWCKECKKAYVKKG